MDLGIYFLITVVFATFASMASGQSTTQQPVALETDIAEDTAMQSLMPYVTVIRGMLQSGMLQSLVNNAADEMLAGANVSRPCLTDVEQIINDVFSRQNYALQFVDAEAKIPPGILQGQWMWFGDYEQCKAIESPYNESTRHVFRGQYCNVMLNRNGQPFFPNGLPLTIGVCLPDSCAKADVHAIASSVVSPLSEFNVTVAFVEMDVEYPYSAGAIVFFVISGVLLLLVIVGTLVDMLYKPVNVDTKQLRGMNNGGFHIEADNGMKTELGKEPVTDEVAADVMDVSLDIVKDPLPIDVHETAKLPIRHVKGTVVEKGPSDDKPFIVKCMIAFSFLSNTNKLLNTSTANGPLACLNGLRVISIWWVIQGHTYSYILTGLDNGAYARETLLSRISFQAIIHGGFAVDTFFFLSGLLVSYLALKEWKKRGRMNWVYYFVHRYWRLTPVYAFLLLFYTNFTFEHLLSGPLKWLGASPNGLGSKGVELCKSYWWTNLLYFNNLYPEYGATDGCMGWSWYLANDMQFYVLVSPVILIVLYKTKILGWVVSGAFVVACVITRGVLVSHYGIKEAGGSSTKHVDDPWGRNALYTYPWTRVSVYVVGMFTGYILYKTKCNVRLNRLVSLIGWVVSVATALSLVYGLYGYYNDGVDDVEMSLTASWFYNAFDRTAWSLCLAWITIACASGYGGWVNSVLSWKIWAPLGRLTYTAYLVHPFVLFTFEYSVTAATHFTDLFMVSSFVSFVVMAYACAYVVSMVAEAPMMQLEKCILNR